MARSTAELVQIIANGGGLDFDASAYSQMDLVRIAANAGNSSATIIMRGIAGRSQMDLVQIAANGKGRVTFVFD